MDLWIKTLVNGEENSFVGYMDTGALVNVMCERKAQELKLDYRNTVHLAPHKLVAFGRVELEAIGYVWVKLGTYCKENEFVEEGFYIVKNEAMVDNSDAYLRCELTRKLGHIVRIQCPACDS